MIEVPPRVLGSEEVPLRALGLSVLALAAPAFGAVLAPDWIGEDSGVLLWLTALVPPFLLTYYRGWKGASVGLAGGMAAVALTQVALVTLDVGSPDYTFLLWMVITYIAICVGIGLLAELLQRERRAAEDMALTDSLTGRPNRRHAVIFLEAAFSAAVRGQPLTVILFDLDRFKRVNDDFGHRAGDEVLKSFAGILEEVTRRMDLSARWGGEEFISILSNCDAAGGEIFASRVLEELRNEIFPWGGVTVSAGIAEYGPGMGSPELIVAAADQALYAAKDAGRDQYRVAGVSVGESAHPGGQATPSASRDHHRTERRSEPHGFFSLSRPERGDEFFVEPPAGVEEEGLLPRGSETLLLVDDDAPVRTGLGRVLTRLGYTVVEAPDGAAALATAESAPRFDLLITDLIMPGMSGFTLGARFHEAYGPARILYMSSHVQGEVAWKGAPGARVAFLEKPMTTETLAGRVRELLDQPVVDRE